MHKATAMSEETKKTKEKETPKKSQAGKGPEWRKGTNFDNYWNSPFWKTLEKRNAKKQKPSK